MPNLLCVHTANITGETAKTGLVEYAATLAKRQNRFNDNAIVGRFLSDCISSTLSVRADWPIMRDPSVSSYTPADFPQESLGDFIQTSAEFLGARPVLVAHLGGYNGRHIAPETLRRFPSVIISHEFSVLNAKDKIPRIAQIAAAQQILFTTEIEKGIVLQAINEYLGGDKAQDVGRRSMIYPVPSNVIAPDQLKSPDERTRDFVTFSTFKKGKGLEFLPTIAAQMKDDLYFAGRKIHVVGTVLGSAGEKILKDLLAHIFTVDASYVDSLGSADVLCLAHQLEDDHYPGVHRKLPLYLHLNQSDEQVNEIMNNHSYAYLPMPRGATGHSGTLSASLDHRMIVFVCHNAEGETPASLQNGCVHLMDNAVDLLNLVKAHERQVANDPSYENRMIEKGDLNRQARNWDGLVEVMSGMAQRAYELYCTEPCEGPVIPSMGQTQHVISEAVFKL